MLTLSTIAPPTETATPTQFGPPVAAAQPAPDTNAQESTSSTFVDGTTSLSDVIAELQAHEASLAEQQRLTTPTARQRFD